jgi:hypothetical protein
MAKAKGFDKNELRLVDSRLKRLSELPGSDMNTILKKVTEEMKKDVISAAPISDGVSRGNLKRSVYAENSDKHAKVWVDTRLTDTRDSAKNFNYGRVVEHGRAGRYKTTPYFYDVINKVLGTLVRMINDKIRDNKLK